MIKILLADDHTIVRQGLRTIIENEPEFVVIGDTDNGLQALELLKENRPDVLIVDLMMPGMNGLETTRQVHQHYPEIKIIILSMRGAEQYVLEAFRNGANGYVLKQSSMDDLVSAINEVIQGRIFLSPQLEQRAIKSYLSRTDDISQDPLETLTRREREILQLAAEGNSIPQIANILLISPNTATTHRNNLMKKLSLHNQTDLVLFAVRRGIITEYK